jgi:hypothetical protein
MAYSKDFRQKVLSIRALLFSVGVASLFRWTKKPEPSKTRNKSVTKIDMEALTRDIEEKPDDFQYE